MTSREYFGQNRGLPISVRPNLAPIELRPTRACGLASMAGVLRGLDFALADELDEVVPRRIFGGRGVAQRDDSRG